jgi:hypothetical protein
MKDKCSMPLSEHGTIQVMSNARPFIRLLFRDFGYFQGPFADLATSKYVLDDLYTIYSRIPEALFKKLGFEV